ncbi:hypothetical protein [Thiocapsa sp.]|uniref:hypothetical protein n=1 Tax=Thiocapsa sp. TaxID=2024551 RepID=UPI0025CFB27F|nr:hypothetical protein [Thiocapsa sp.]
MGQAALKQEVDTLRESMKELSYQAMRTEMSLARLSEEMLEFKDEMSSFKDEMLAFNEESQRERRSMNKQWGDLANRLGTPVEDIVAPNLPRVAAELFSCPVADLFGVRVVRRFGGETREYDALLVCPEVVLVNETKSRLTDAHVEGILERLAEIPHVFPEYADRRAVGVLASLYPDASVVRRATRRGVLVMGMGDETMHILNPEALESGG